MIRLFIIAVVGWTLLAAPGELSKDSYGMTKEGMDSRFRGNDGGAKADTVWEDLILNPSFEDSAGRKNLDHWENTYPCTYPDSSNCLDTITPQGGGNYSARVWTCAPHCRSNRIKYVIKDQKCKGIYKLSFWMKAEKSYPNMDTFYDYEQTYHSVFRIIRSQGIDTYKWYPSQELFLSSKKIYYGSWNEYTYIDTLNIQATDTFTVSFNVVRYNSFLSGSALIDLVHFEKLKEL